MAGPVTTSRCPSDRACKGLDGMAGRKDLACSKVRKAGIILVSKEPWNHAS